jgi:hypothetical protein
VNAQSTDWRIVVGIVQNGKYESLNDSNEPAVVWPRSQRYDSTITVVARSPLTN